MAAFVSTALLTFFAVLVLAPRTAAAAGSLPPDVTAVPSPERTTSPAPMRGAQRPRAEKEDRPAAAEPAEPSPELGALITTAKPVPAREPLQLETRKAVPSAAAPALLGELPAEQAESTTEPTVTSPSSSFPTASLFASPTGGLAVELVHPATVPMLSRQGRWRRQTPRLRLHEFRTRAQVRLKVRRRRLLRHQKRTTLESSLVSMTAMKDGRFRLARTVL